VGSSSCTGIFHPGQARRGVEKVCFRRCASARQQWRRWVAAAALVSFIPGRPGWVGGAPGAPPAPQDFEVAVPRGLSSRARSCQTLGSLLGRVWSGQWPVGGAWGKEQLWCRVAEVEG